MRARGEQGGEGGRERMRGRKGGAEKGGGCDRRKVRYKVRTKTNKGNDIQVGTEESRVGKKKNEKEKEDTVKVILCDEQNEPRA